MLYYLSLGTFRQVARPGQNVVLRNIPPRYTPAMWNVNAATITDGARTNNLCEAWNKSFLHLIGHAHPSIWSCIQALKRDNMMVHMALDRHELGFPLQKRISKKAANLQSRLKRICEEHQNGLRNDISLLRAVGHTIRF